MRRAWQIVTCSWRVGVTNAAGHHLVGYWELSRWLRHLKTPANQLVEATSCCRGPRPQEITWGGLEVQGGVSDLCRSSALGLGCPLPGPGLRVVVTPRLQPSARGEGLGLEGHWAVP